jgi:hypothetical protein
MRAHTLMVGCSAGEGHLDAMPASCQMLRWPKRWHALPRLARELGCVIIVLKNFQRGTAPHWRAWAMPASPASLLPDFGSHVNIQVVTPSLLNRGSNYWRKDVPICILTI